MTEPIAISVLLAVRNEAPNIRKCLAALTRADEVVLVDSNSTDDTAQIAIEEFNRDVVQFEYTGGYPKKRQWALNEYPFRHEWILLLDADEVVTDALWQEIELTLAAPAFRAYYITKSFHFMEQQFRYGGFSHAAVLLLKRGCGHFEETLAETDSGVDMEVHERIVVDDRIGRLSNPLVHEDYKGLKAYIDRHNAYSTWEAQLRYRYLNTGEYGSDSIKPLLFGDTQSRRRFVKHISMKLPFEPIAWFVYHYILRLGFLEGRPGLIASQLRAGYIRDIRAKVYELKQQTRP